MKKLFMVLGMLMFFVALASASYAGEHGRMAGGRYVQDGYVLLPLQGFQLGATVITTSTTPGWEEDDAATSLVWADGEATSAVQTFIVPPDYKGNGRFIAMCTASAVGTASKLDFDVYINKAGVAADSSATNQDPVSLTAGNTSSPTYVELTPATDFDSLTGNDAVTLRLARDDQSAGTADLELKSVIFLYDPLD